MAKKKVTVYTVQTVCWEYNDETYDRLDWTFDPKSASNPSEYGTEVPTLVRSFLSREKAEAHALELERGRRGEVGPAIYYGPLGGGLADFTSLPEQQFLARLRELGVVLPALDRRGRIDPGGLYDWWDRRVAKLRGDTLHAVWDLFDQVRFYQVVPMQVELEG